MIVATYYVFKSYDTSPSKFRFKEEEVLLAFLLMASASLQLGWCGYLINAIRPRAEFSRMEFVIPESELIEEEEEEYRMLYG